MHAELLLKQDIPFSMPCGQNGTCGKCAVIATGDLTTPDARELKKISDMPQNTRLACQCVANGDCQIILPQKNNRIVSDGIIPEFTLDAMDGDYGFAVDIGTTTVAVYLYNLKTGKCLKRNTFMNPQSSFGADVISRIEKAVGGMQDALAATIRDAIEDAFKSMMDAEQIKVNTAVITGNTAMLYLFTKEDTTPLTAAPFEIKNYLGTTVIGLFKRFPDMKVYLPKTAAAFVGSDITCFMLACEMNDTKQTVLMVDIGTNGEMGLIHDGKLSVCATAAGPAFEGAGITFGMAAGDGAIDSVTAADGIISCTTIGNQKAVGICGTGLIDAAATISSIIKINRKLELLNELQKQIHNVSDFIGENVSEKTLEISDKSKPVIENIEVKKEEVRTRAIEAKKESNKIKESLSTKISKKEFELEQKTIGRRYGLWCYQLCIIKYICWC